jgi:hypothetical protein
MKLREPLIRPTVGKIVYDNYGKQEESRDPIELQRAMQEDYITKLLQSVESNKKIFSGNFYVVVITKAERLLKGVFRNYFATRQTCPTPEYDQTVFMYNRELERIEYIWTVPSQDTCIHFKNNILQIVESERDLLKFILDFSDGTLLKLAKKLNGEKEKSPELERK